MRLPTLILTALLLVGENTWAAPEVNSQNLCSVATISFGEAERIRGLRRKRSVPCLVQDKAEVRRHLELMVTSKLPAQKLQNEEALYRGLGIIPEDYNYSKGILDLYVSQLGGYYDPEARHFVMAGWMPGALQTPIAVHELTHALQDQHFNLLKMMDPKSDNSDELLARSALAEGDATAVMIDYSREAVGQPGLAHESDVDGIMLQNVMGMGMASGLDGVPRALKVTLLFPYTSGLRFAHIILRRGGYAEINKVFRSPPQTTEEILHPEKLGNRNEWREISNTSVRPNASYGDTIGEFGIVALLSAYISDTARVSAIGAGWAGDRAVLSEKNGVQEVAWRSYWDTETDAKEFKDALAELIQNGSLKGATVSGVGLQVDFVRRVGS